MLVDSDVKALEDSDLNGIYRVQDFKNQKFLQLDDILDREKLNVLIRQKLLEKSENMEEGYETIEKKM